MMPGNNRFALLTFVAACGVFDRAASFSNSGIARLAPPPKTPTKAVRGTSRRTLSSTLFASSALPDERPDNNPSTKFGSPLSDSMKVGVYDPFIRHAVECARFVCRWEGGTQFQFTLFLRSLTSPCQCFTLCANTSKDVNKAGVDFIKSSVIDLVFAGEDRAYARFYALETIARVPYFSYLSVLHLYETLGRWRRAKYLKLHFAESWNELHHLMIMEELGGNARFFDRFIAQHIAFGYYAIVAFLYLLNPVEAYNLNQGVEEHAYNTYDTYLKENEESLKKLPAPKAAIDYYINGDLWLFDEFQTDCQLRRPKIENLYDVFVAVRDDELAHVNTMKMLQPELDVSSMRDGECEIDLENL